MALPDYITRYESKTGKQFSVPDGFQLAFKSKTIKEISYEKYLYITNG